MTYLVVKYLHVLAATTTICGFIVRGYWMMSGSHKLELRVTRIAPHIVDTIFLLSGIAMLALLSLNPLQSPWLVAKLAAVVAYILLGAVALRRGPTREIRIVAFVAALSSFSYVAGVALSKSPASWLAFLT